MRTEEHFIPEADDRPLSQQELEAWWPFKRLEPSRFPKQAPTPKHLDEFEDAPF
jgi:hypothetical protein